MNLAAGSCVLHAPTSGSQRVAEGAQRHKFLQHVQGAQENADAGSNIELLTADLAKTEPINTTLLVA